MPERSATVVSYAAGASLAAVALIYVFGPTFTIDHDSGNSSRKTTIVGLRNQANDCFINSVLQALAGLGDLRVYLIRETHRRHIEDPAVYQNLVQPQAGARLEQWKLQGLQEGLVTRGLKDMLDALNERPIARKSISPFPFVKVLEAAFKQRISRQQQDAQEFLQIVAERLKDEYRAAVDAQRPPDLAATNGDDAEPEPKAQAPVVAEPEVEESFPMEGKYESHIECLACRYRTKPREESFCTLTLAVPHVSSTSLSACFDGIFKTEFVDDFKCEMCRLVQAKATLEHELARSTSDGFRAQAKDSIEKLAAAIETDPEQPPVGVELGDIRYAPKRRIGKTTRMTIFPKVLAIHLSRSIYGVGQMTQKNSAKVAFPERLPLGGLADQHKYKLLGIITHRGGHNSGHYEAFRRQNQPSPYHNANTFQPSDIYSKTSTPVSTPRMAAARQAGSPATSTPDLLSASPATNSSTPSLESMPAAPRSVPPEMGSPQSDAKDRDADTSSLRSVAASTKSALSRLAPSKAGQDSSASPRSSKAQQAAPAKRAKKRKPASDRWWRVSDEKVREAKTSEVLGMQREVYMLFYELEE
ncbi:ubiquitin carboxyl-terminal hydrolase [Hirsutella rhossiliensis]|uniref:Ubiquitin carboxyl-terminal hydrolase n=1 Tax=Hirsutella rhossiliensis TaxID=111463 RepID=A0A9P8MY04_9HYPO|nr:ubiquitin carboxyl-terminal hydrolase domain-containing protein [Hirsutella rhossiliensis]KAH0963315.1 ubiquitin carboxyl-terminal hydrolase domain-containing protein [Hirsutella rhossiliensis]